MMQHISVYDTKVQRFVIAEKWLKFAHFVVTVQSLKSVKVAIICTAVSQFLVDV